MPLALLLSPDDQAVSAITSVLEEMSVTCERPLDGVSAAQKLNSHSFDLVLVDCENLPAAKLIFDVCRRGRSGHNPVPIAIVDGRAGLPTAFRLGAELILTKPVAKDQARNTIRTAVGRVKKEEPAHTTDPINTVKAETLQSDAGPVNQGSSIKSDDPKTADEHALAATAAAGSPQLTSYSDPVPAATLSALAPAPAMTMTMTMSAPVAAPEISDAPAAKAASVLVESKPSVSHPPSDDPVLAELEKAEEAHAEPQPIFSSYPESQKKLGKNKEGQGKRDQSEQGQNKQGQNKNDQSENARKTRGPLVAVLVLVLVCAGFYAAWMYQPGFRTFAQPQIDRVLVLAGVVPHRQAPAPLKPAQGIKAPVPTSSADSAQASQLATTNPSAGATTPSTTPSAAPASSPSSATTSSATATSANAASQNGVNQNAVRKYDAGTKSAAHAQPSDAELPGEKTALILSSKGAEKRLMHSVQPTYPAGAGPAEATIVLKAVVDENGKVAGVRVVEGNPALATAAINAVRQWRYRPYVRDGKVLPFQTVVLVDFQRP